MKKFLKILITFTILCFATFGAIGVKPNKYKTTGSASADSLVATVTLTANDVTRGGVDCKIEINKDLDVPSTAIRFEYRTIEPEEELYSKFKKSYKELTSQAKIGKIVYIKLSCPDYPEVETYLQTANVTLKVYMPTFLLNKSTYFVDFAYTPESSSARVLKDDVVVEDNNFVVYNMRMSTDGCYVALVYDGSLTIVIICIVAFLIILAFCIYLKIRKMHKEDPEYYEALKKEKAEKKNNALKNRYYEESLTMSTNKKSKDASSTQKSSKQTTQTAQNSNKKNKPTPKQVKRKF